MIGCFGFSTSTFHFFESKAAVLALLARADRAPPELPLPLSHPIGPRHPAAAGDLEPTGAYGSLEVFLKKMTSKPHAVEKPGDREPQT